MEVAVMYSGGKDSTRAIEHCLEKGWTIKYLLSVKPSRTDCYLFHFATVEHTVDIAKILGIKHIYVGCDVADAAKEAEIVRNIVKDNIVEAVVLGGTGLQETQIRSIRDALFPLGVEVFASHTGKDHYSLMKDEIERGYEIIITQVAVEGLGREWLGKKIDKLTLEELKKKAEKYGFHVGAEGGHFDSLTVDAPFFDKRLEILDSEKVMENDYCGYLKINKARIVEKRPEVFVHRRV